MVLHFGHFVQRPSGISFFLDFEVSLGFFTKVVWGGDVWGVTAGSTTVSRPRDFFVKEVVLIATKRGQT
jgi:hypothetical protein